MEVGKKMNLDNLNDKQKEAVLYNDGPLLIIAGAGAGKTKTLTSKIKPAIINKLTTKSDLSFKALVSVLNVESKVRS